MALADIAETQVLPPEVSEKTKCPICWVEFPDDPRDYAQASVMVLPCMHKVHSDCIEEYALVRQKHALDVGCPECKTIPSELLSAGHGQVGQSSIVLINDEFDALGDRGDTMVNEHDSDSAPTESESRQESQCCPCPQPGCGYH